MRRIAVVFLLLAAACSSPSGPSGPTLKFEKGIVFGIPTIPTTAVVDGKTIRITGVIQTVTSGFTLFGELKKISSHSFALYVEAEETGPGFRFPTQNVYRATLFDLAPGDYELQVFHTNHGSATAVTERVFHDTIHFE